jgi:cytidylate kinase
MAAAVACTNGDGPGPPLAAGAPPAAFGRLTMAARPVAIVGCWLFARPGLGKLARAVSRLSRGGGVDVRPVVTLAALYGAGGDVVGPRVAERLGVPFLDRAIPRSVAQRAGLSEAAVADVDEEPRSRWNQVLRALGRASPPTGASGQVERLDLEFRKLHSEIERFLADASRSGGVVLGRGGAVVLASVPGALHVYLGGNRDRRIERVMDQHGVDQSTAARLVTANDWARRDYVRSAYGIDGDDPALYHLMIEAVSLGVEVCVDLIVAASESLTRASGRREAGGGDRDAQAS